MFGTAAPSPLTNVALVPGLEDTLEGADHPVDDGAGAAGTFRRGGQGRRGRRGARGAGFRGDGDDGVGLLPRLHQVEPGPGDPLDLLVALEALGLGLEAAVLLLEQLQPVVGGPEVALLGQVRPRRCASEGAILIKCWC